MKHRFTINLSISLKGRLRKLWRLLQNIMFGLFLILLGWLTFTTITLVFASPQPVDAFFVLGGSIRREIYVAQLVQKYPQTPILISHGSPDPCILLIFQREVADLQELQKVWLENCANSTFENFYYGVPILQSWGVRKVKLITSGSHVLRAKLMAQIILGAHGIWVEPEVVEEIGIPGNREFLLKTVLDIIRSLFWAIFSQFIQPQCSQVTKLIDVDILSWEQRGFHCEHQGQLGK
ncbi:YdcF family protein [Sphaerospermopsis aphanizomenoides BCCUSP55]|uniref:YdcF family protein n=1 Tax=Sphaerospermopsis aphanizomenoides TaxID=459663 RepID=UPI001904A099|nr:YdcF family protein [Sphaerospermopsis aphanizomenoides]MBK1990304.1 YdcF family protein [Sphaerospermopsis aphanizomenoides BCCUSP55]